MLDILAVIFLNSKLAYFPLKEFIKLPARLAGFGVAGSDAGKGCLKDCCGAACLGAIGGVC